MDDNEIFDFEKFRTKFESEEHWTLKKKFLEAHQNNFPEERLICLAQIFVNVELLRCRYSDKVMSLIAELGKGIGTDYKTKQLERLQRTFVSASDAARLKGRVNIKENKKEDNQDVPIPNLQLKQKEKNLAVPIHQLMKFDKERSVPIHQLMKFDKERSVPNLQLKKLDQDTVPNLPLKKLDQDTVPNLPLKKGDQNSPETNPKSGCARKQWLNQRLLDEKELNDIRIVIKKYTGEVHHPSFSNVFLVFKNYEKYNNWQEVLQESLNYSRLELIKEILTEKVGKTVCRLEAWIGSEKLLLGSGSGCNAITAQMAAVENALHTLWKNCVAIEVKKIDNCDALSMQFEKCVVRSENNELSDDNVGYKMLKTMGWSGGGLGRYGMGITKPVNSFAGENLDYGCTMVPVKSVKKVKKVNSRDAAILIKMMAVNIKKNKPTPNLAFALIDVDNDTRKKINNLMKTYKNLELHSVKDSLIIAPKIDPFDVFRKVYAQGGETNMFKIYKPGTVKLNFGLKPLCSGTEEPAAKLPPNKYVKMLNKEGVCPTRISACSPKISSMQNFAGNKSSYEPEMSQEQFFNTNVFIYFRAYLNTNIHDILSTTFSFCGLSLIERFDYNNIAKQFEYAIGVKVGGQERILGAEILQSNTNIDLKNQTRKKLRLDTAATALKYLLKHCYTIMVKKNCVGEREITLEEFKRDDVEQIGKITDDNVGSKLLKLMGWTGGGLGKDGEGIKEPILPRSVLKRQGLTARSETDVTPVFMKKVDIILGTMKANIINYPDEVIPDLVFAPDFSSEQRKYIHLKVLERFKNYMKSKSYGKNTQRYLSVSPIYDCFSIFRKITLKGGVTEMYEISEPGTLTPENFTQSSLGLL